MSGGRVVDGVQAGGPGDLPALGAVGRLLAVEGERQVVTLDTTDQFWARRRLALLNKASMRIGSTLDVGRTAEELAELAVEDFADFVTVDLLSEVVAGDEARSVLHRDSISFHRAAQCSVLEGCPESIVAVGETHAYDSDSVVGRTLIKGEPARMVLDEVALRRWRTIEPVRSQSMRDHKIHSVMVVPLRARGVILGTTLFCRHRTPGAFGAADLQLAAELVSRAAVCVDNARRYTRERATALALQRSLLPRRAARQKAVEVTARYLPNTDGAGIGGDWFDVIPLSGARVALVVGDVVGHGLHASATMGRLRTAVRTLADVDLAPDELLTQLDGHSLDLTGGVPHGRHGRLPDVLAPLHHELGLVQLALPCPQHPFDGFDETLPALHVESGLDLTGQQSHQ